MKRMKVLFGQRRIMVLATLAILVLTAAALAASSASFTATSANPGNAFTAGSLDILNTKEGQILVTSTNMKPGDSPSSTVSISNNGTIAGTFSLTKTKVASSGAEGFDNVLQLTIVDETAEVTIYSGSLSGYLGGGTSNTYTYAAPWAPDNAVVHDYTFTVAWPATRTGSIPATPIDNDLMGASCEYSFDWKAVQ